MTKTLLPLFLLTCNLLCVIADARADRLFETDLLKQDKNYQVDPVWSSNSVIEGATANIQNDPTRKDQFLFDIASAKAHQGKLTAALEDLAKIDSEYIKCAPDFLEERAEIKSLLGFDESAIQDIDKISANSQSWQILWHKSLIFERAGKPAEAKLLLQKALTNLQHSKVENIFAKTLRQVAREQQLVALTPDSKQKELALSMFQSLLTRPSAPEKAETLKALGLNENSRRESKSGEDTYLPLSSNSPLCYATITPDGEQIRVYIDSTACMISPDIVREQFDAATEQELWPGSMSGCGPGTLTLFQKKSQNSSPSVQFVFDGAKEQALTMFSVVYKKQSTISRRD